MGKKVVWGVAAAAILVVVVYFVYTWRLTPGENSSKRADSFNSPTYRSIGECPEVAQDIIRKHRKINKDQIEGCQEKLFIFDGKPVRLVHVEYGEAQDCMAGCFFSHYCAIVEDGIEYPYVSYGKEALFASDDTSTRTGKSHTLASSSQFVDFLTQTLKEGGEFRFCRVGLNR